MGGCLCVFYRLPQLYIEDIKEMQIKKIVYESIFKSERKTIAILTSVGVFVRVCVCLFPVGD